MLYDILKDQQTPATQFSPLKLHTNIYWTENSIMIFYYEINIHTQTKKPHEETADLKLLSVKPFPLLGIKSCPGSPSFLTISYCFSWHFLFAFNDRSFQKSSSRSVELKFWKVPSTDRFSYVRLYVRLRPEELNVKWRNNYCRGLY